MFEVDTVFIIATSRGSYVTEDIVRAIRWTCTSTYHILIIDRGDNIQLPADIADGYTVLSVKDTARGLSDDFVRGIGIKYAFDKQIKCKMFVGLSDECMILQQNFDSFLLTQLSRQNLGLLGVRDRINYESYYGSCSAMFEEWGLPHTDFSPDNTALHGAFLAISYELGQGLFDANLLARSDLDTWELPYGPFISWVSQMLGFYQVAWGDMDKPLPPLYMNHTGKSRFQPAPHILLPSFSLYYSSRCVRAYTEEEIRESYKLARGEMAKQPIPVRPVVSPQQIGPTVNG